MNHYDVIVVGAGPGGARPARLLASWGLKVLLLEKEGLPRYKACGGGLTRRALHELGLDPNRFIERWVFGSHCRLDEKHQTVIAREDEPQVAMVMRDRFDATLTLAAVESGAVLQDKTKVLTLEENSSSVKVRTTAGSFSASYLVGADGACSTVAKFSGLKISTDYNPAIEAEIIPHRGRIDAPYDKLAFYDLGIIRGGYGWVFPKKEHYSVGICSTYPRAYNLMPLFHSFLDSLPFLHRSRIKRIKGWFIPAGTTSGRIATERCLLTGDAAGCVDPFTGEGIAYALRSGILAAEALRKAIFSGAGPGLKAYSEAMKKDIYSNFKLSKWFAKLYYATPRLAFRMLLKDERVVHHFFELMSGKISYHDIFRLVWKNWWRLRWL